MLWHQEVSVAFGRLELERVEDRELAVTRTVGEKRSAVGRGASGKGWTLGVRLGQGPLSAHGVLTACEPWGIDPDGTIRSPALLGY